jgi:gluconate 2-dehydrogenase gamma chain
MLGVALLPASTVTAGEAQQLAKSIAPPSHPHEDKAARFFTPEQHALVEELSETIIPADSHSGGAKAAKVADYIEQTLRETHDDTQKAMWREALPLMDSMCQHYTGKAFVNASPEERVAVLTVLSDNIRMTELPEVRFFKELKRITVEGYYTSKIGIHDELQYKGNRILKEYVGCDDQGAATT